MTSQPRIAHKDKNERLRIGMIGSGFIAKFHLQSLIGVRHVIVSGVYSPTREHRKALARDANEKEFGPE